MYLDFVDSNGRVTIMTTPLSSQQAAISPKTLSESAIILQTQRKRSSSHWTPCTTPFPLRSSHWTPCTTPFPLRCNIIALSLKVFGEIAACWEDNGVVIIVTWPLQKQSLFDL